MKKLSIVFIVVMLLMACGKEGPEEIEQTVVGESDRLEELFDQEELSEDDEKELYLIALNSILNKYDEEYEMFDIKTGTDLYKSIKPIANQDVKVANGMRKSLVELMDEEQQEVYGSFLNDIIELEETFSHLEWE